MRLRDKFSESEVKPLTAANGVKGSWIREEVVSGIQMQLFNVWHWLDLSPVMRLLLFPSVVPSWSHFSVIIAGGIYRWNKTNSACRTCVCVCVYTCVRCVLIPAPLTTRVNYFLFKPCVFSVVHSTPRFPSFCHTWCCRSVFTFYMLL